MDIQSGWETNASGNAALAIDRETKSNNILAHFPWKIFSIIFAAAYLVIVTYFGDVPPLAMLSYIGGQVVFVLIPGMALGVVISVADEKIKYYCLSYFLGIFIYISVFTLVYLTGLKDYFLYVMIAVSLIGIWVLFKKRTFFQSLKTNNAAGTVLSISTAALLLIILFYTIFNNFTPDFTPNTTYYHDQLFNVGNITALYLNLPPQDIRNLGFSFNYHYLYNLFLAGFKNMFGISSFDLLYKLFPVTQIILFSSSIYLLFSKYIKNVLYVGLCIALILLADQFIFHHVMWAAFNTTVGMAMSLIAALFYMNYFEHIDSAKILDKNFLLGTLFFGMSFFSKSSFAIVLAAGIGVILIGQLLRRKNIRNILVHGVITISIIALAYMALVQGVVGFNGFTKGFATLMTSNAPSYYVWAVQNWGASIPPFFIKLIWYPVFLATRYTPVPISFVLLIIAFIKWRREDLKKEIFLFTIIVAGTLLASAINQPGHSNMFFIMIAIPFSVLAIVLVLKRFCCGPVKKTAKRVLIASIAAFLILSAGFNINSIRTTNLITLKQYPASGLSANPVVNTNPNANSISYDEYLGMLWIRDNTPKDAVIAGDRFYYTPSPVLNDARYFYYTAFSERQFYLEGFEYTNTTEKNFEQIIQDKLQTLKLAYQNDRAAIEKLKQAGVQYLVRSEFTSASSQISREFASIVFGNKDIIIYKLN